MTTSSLLHPLDQIRVQPHLTAGIRLNNTATGATYGKRTFSLSANLSLFKAMGTVAGILLMIRLLMILQNYKREQKIKRKYRKKIRVMKEKMSKS